MTRLCTQLEELRQDADQRGERAELERVIDGVVRGGSAAVACRRLDLDVDVRGGRPEELPGLAGLGIRSRGLTGHYSCPLHRCNRQEDMAEVAGQPACAVGGAPMLFRSDEPEPR